MSTGAITTGQYFHMIACSPARVRAAIIAERLASRNLDAIFVRAQRRPVSTKGDTNAIPTNSINKLPAASGGSGIATHKEMNAIDAKLTAKPRNAQQMTFVQCNSFLQRL